MVTDVSIAEYPNDLRMWINLPRKLFDIIKAREKHAPEENESGEFWVKVVEKDGVMMVFKTNESPK